MRMPRQPGPDFRVLVRGVVIDVDAVLVRLGLALDPVQKADELLMPAGGVPCTDR